MFSTKQQYVNWFGMLLTLLPDLILANTPPVISGDPASTTAAGSEYTFQPKISDQDGDAVSLIIRRKPNWLTFDTSTSELSGTPEIDDVGSYNNILIMAKANACKIGYRNTVSTLRQPHWKPLMMITSAA